MGDERFSRTSIEVLAKRAGFVCSNPECNAGTSGPAQQDGRAVNVGEAAHIYGGRPGAARYRDDMTDLERSEVINAIWLCCTCHKKIDDDPLRYPADLLFEWRASHEGVIAQNLGKTAATLRQKVTEKHLADFEDCGYLARQIIIDRPKMWEYHLTAEILLHVLKPVKARWDALNKGLYSLPPRIIKEDDFTSWFGAVIQTIVGQNAALIALLGPELKSAWGPPGQPGSEHEIRHVSKLVSEACQRILEWEETVRFAKLPDDFGEVQALLCGISGPTIEQVFGVPLSMKKVLADPSAQGTYTINLAVTLPDNFSENVTSALNRAYAARAARNA